MSGAGARERERADQCTDEYQRYGDGRELLRLRQLGACGAGEACDDLRILRARLYLVIGIVKRLEMARFCWLRIHRSQPSQKPGQTAQPMGTPTHGDAG